MKAQIEGTYGKSRVFREVSALPDRGDEWIQDGYEHAKVLRVLNINNCIAETTAGDPTRRYTFYRIEINYDGDVFNEHVVIDRGWD